MNDFYLIEKLIYLGFEKWRIMVQKSVHSTFNTRESKGCTSNRFVSIRKLLLVYLNFVDGKQWFRRVYTRPPSFEKSKGCTSNRFGSVRNIIGDKRQIIGSEECTLNLRFLRDKRMLIRSSRLLLISILNMLIKKRRTTVQQGVHPASVIRETKGCASDYFDSFLVLNDLNFNYEKASNGSKGCTPNLH